MMCAIFFFYEKITPRFGTWTLVRQHVLGLDGLVVREPCECFFSQHGGYQGIGALRVRAACVEINQ